MKKALIGAGGFANEVKAHMGEYDLISFVDDLYYNETDKNTKPLSQFNPNEWEVLIAIGDPTAREELSNRLPIETKYFTFIHPSVLILGTDVEIGEGSVICAGSIITTNCKIGKHTHLNLMSTVGHDCIIGDYMTTAPGVKISGNCNIGKCVYIGTNASIKQKISICDYTVIGLNAGVFKNITEPGVYVGVPSKKIK